MTTSELRSHNSGVFIYALFSTEDPTHIRYVGKTKNKLKYRLQQHLTGAKGRESSYKRNWIHNTIQKGFLVNIKLLEECEDFE